jgi:hypothetical protein
MYPEIYVSRKSPHTHIPHFFSYAYVYTMPVDGRIILRWIFRKWEGVAGTGWSWLRIGTSGGHL